ncbi:MAG: hypothetical protein R3D28_25645 [Geminicoccaceae bacterium]
MSAFTSMPATITASSIGRLAGNLSRVSPSVTAWPMPVVVVLAEGQGDGGRHAGEADALGHGGEDERRQHGPFDHALGAHEDAKDVAHGSWLLKG